MLVVWASWCGPCRKEFPVIRELYKKYLRDELNIISVSIDDSQLKWQNALKEEALPWTQFITQDQDRKNIYDSLMINSIPLTIFVDGKGFEIARFVGYKSDNINAYSLLIDSVLNNRK